MSIMMVQVDVMCCKSVGTDLSMLDIDDLMTEICQLKKEVKLLETKLRERDELNRKDVCGVSLCDVTDQTSPDLLLSVCNEEQKTSVKLLDCEMKLKTQIKEEQTHEDDVIYSDLMEVKTEFTELGQQTEQADSIYSDLMEVKEESSEPNELEENNFMTGEESLSCLRTKKNFPQQHSFTCSQCGKIFRYKSKLNRHMRSHTRERPYRCDQCGSSFVLKSKLYMHMRSHTGVRPYRCDQCGKIFNRKDNLRRHMTIHTGEKSYKCDQCERTYSRKDHLNEHMRVHTGEKPYRCGQCGKSFVLAAALRDHLLCHSKVRSFQCKQCNEAFFSTNTLKIHMKTHTDVKSHVSPICGKAFSQPSKFKDHQKTTHTGVASQKLGNTFTTKEKSYRCSSCGQSFRESGCLEIHMKKCCKVHPQRTIQTRRSLRLSAVTC